MLPWLKNTGSIITDTSSISPVSLNASRLLSRYSNDVPCRVDMLQQYHDGTQNTLDQLESAIERAVDREGDILFLISVSMSGKLEKLIKQSVDRLVRCDKATMFLSIYNVCELELGESLCNIQEYGLEYSKEDSSSLKDVSVVEIDKNSYFPHNSSGVEIEI